MQTDQLPGGSRLVWNGEAFAAAFRAEMERRLRIAGEVVKAVAQQRLRSISARSAGHSRPGQFPHADTGRLANSVIVLAAGLEVIIGTNLDYGLWLEYGTAGGKIVTPKGAKALSWIGADGKRRFAKSIRLGAIAARPWLRLALLEAQPRIRAIVEAPWDGAAPGGSLGVEMRNLAA